MKNRLFSELLHEARRLKAGGFNRNDRKMYMLGMLRMHLLRLEEIRIAEGMMDVWANQASGAD